MCIRKPKVLHLLSTVTFEEKVDIYKEITQKKGGDMVATKKCIATLPKHTQESEKNIYYVTSTSEELCKNAKIPVNDKCVFALVNADASVTVLSEEFYRMCYSPSLLNKIKLSLSALAMNHSFVRKG